MGLALEVGILADLRENDEEGYEYWQQQFEALNEFLRASGLPAHNEPDDCEVWSCEMYGYSGIHYLRRIAAHLDSYNRMPSPGDNRSSEDAVLRDYLMTPMRVKPGFVERLFKRSPTHNFSFNHLIVHSDAAGLYLPMKFDNVLLPPSDLGIAGGEIGSSPRLLDECERLAAVLEIPSDMNENSEALSSAPDMQGQAETKWQRYGVESFTCVNLMKACGQSIKAGAAIVFT